MEAIIASLYPDVEIQNVYIFIAFNLLIVPFIAAGISLGYVRFSKGNAEITITGFQDVINQIHRAKDIQNKEGSKVKMAAILSTIICLVLFTASYFLFIAGGNIFLSVLWLIPAIITIGVFYKKHKDKDGMSSVPGYLKDLYIKE